MSGSRYLLLYNAVMTAGWTIVLYRLVHALATGGDIYAAVATPLKIYQTGALLEVLHSATGLIRASAMTTALQVASRLGLLWGVVHPVPTVRANVSFVTMVLAWSLTEIPRYFYFTVGFLTSRVPYWLTVLRYSTFIPLYPLGASSEWLTMYAALPYIQKTGLFSISMPNAFNFAFDYSVACIICLILYVPGLPHMFMHMMRQRSKYTAVPPAEKAVKIN